jgi:CheY-like chemotaxis protein
VDVERQLRQQHSGSHLLLVEDNLINREVVVEILHGGGMEVDTAEDGCEAVALNPARPVATARCAAASGD